jgi:phage antirepressor YoqD-like protein
MITIDNPIRMTSREIADLVELRHDNVKRSIEKLISDGVISHPQIEDGIKAANGVMEKQYVICKRDSYVIVAQLSPAFTARLVDRWQELESKAIALPDFSNRAAAARAWADAEEARQTLQIQLEAAQPALDFVNRYADATGSKGFRQVCKLLRANENEFRLFLQAQKIMYRLNGEWVPHSCHLDAGRFAVKAGEANQHAFNQTQFTPKGVTWIAGEWAKYQLEEAMAA